MLFIDQTFPMQNEGNTSTTSNIFRNTFIMSNQRWYLCGLMPEQHVKYWVHKLFSKNLRDLRGL